LKYQSGTDPGGNPMYKLVIADDEIGIREGLSKTIDWGSIGIEIAGIAEDGEEAFEIICDTSPDIIISDIRMPGMDGMELISAVRKSALDCKVIIISGYSDFHYAQKAVKLGAFDYLLKPVEEKELVSRISECILEIEKQRNERAEKENLKRKLLTNEAAIKNHRLLEYITGSNPLPEDLEALPGTAGKPDGNLLSAAAVVNIQNLLDTVSDVDKDKCLEEVFTALSLLIDCNSRTILKNEPSEIILLFSSLSDDSSSFKNLLADMLAELQKQLVFRFNSDISIGLGKVYGTMALLPYSYNEAVTAYCFRLFDCCEPVFDIDKVLQTVNGMKISTDFEKQIYNFVKLEDKSAVDKSLKQLIRAYVNLSRGREVEKLKLVIINALEYCFSNLGESILYSIHLDVARDILVKKLYTAKNIEEIYYLSRTALFDAIDSLSSSPGKNVRKIICQALEYVSQHYHENLTMNEVAKKLFLTPSYFSKIFSDEVGEPFSKYLVRLRIEKARELLKDPCLKVYEIAEEVGYSDPRHFMKIFKEYTGITAVQYRENF